MLRAPAVLTLLTALGCSRAPDATAVYQAAAPSIAFVRTPAAFGSGVVLRDGVIVTNAHVVWPYAEARVSFPGESVPAEAKVLAIDVMADLALLGPVAGHAGLTLAPDAETLPIGAPVFLVGYPGEVDDFPRPTLTAGVLSRLREARFADLTFLQADVTIVGGQSGGALLAGDGRVLGISGLAGIGERNFALVLSSQDVIARVEAMRARPAPLVRTSFGTRAKVQSVSAHGSWGQRVFVVELEEHQRLELRYQGAGELTVRGPDSDELTLEDGTLTAEVPGPHFVFVTSDGEQAKGTLTSDVELTALLDPDDERVLTVGSVVSGALDYPTDVDRYLLELKQGDHLHVRVDGVLDVRAAIDFETASEKSLASAVAGEGGLGLSADLEFTAPKTARYYLAVDEGNPEGPAGYQVRVDANGAVRPREPKRSLFAVPK